MTPPTAAAPRGRARRLGVTFVALLAVAGLSGCGAMQRISEGAYRNAVADGAVADLRARGVRLHARPVCQTPSTGTVAEVRITCTARTTDGQPVQIRGTVTAADTAEPRERYQVTVGGRLLIDRDCIGTGCRRTT
ncbi:hypothetical protein DZF91_26185 [Actinomadura logoneensis]|uniref:DUF4333 domain-containing protein n=1 Tax=Actinomadura logoneensis TaxID=2293572 RepID=A0A372JFP2_9ACTN|nr:hypothetical protein [Actinomadura logoneensis]RFU38719.1 hypothetical protein DZF91_26185 [Actinomadura logoneensis]